VHNYNIRNCENMQSFDHLIACAPARSRVQDTNTNYQPLPFLYHEPSHHELSLGMLLMHVQPSFEEGEQL
jgi:hypothetical protein